MSNEKQTNNSKTPPPPPPTTEYVRRSRDPIAQDKTKDKKR